MAPAPLYLGIDQFRVWNNHSR